MLMVDSLRRDVGALGRKGSSCPKPVPHRSAMLQPIRYTLIVALTCSACGSSPAAPAPIPVPVPPAQITLSGRVTATNGGQPLAGVQAALGANTVATDGAGGFSFQMLPAGTLALALTGSGIVPRSVYVAAGSSRAVAVDAISTAGFDLNFYRQIARNAFEVPTFSQPLRRWTRNPNIYIQTASIDTRTLDMVEQVIREAVPQWTAGRYSVASVERGDGTRENQADWLTVKWNPANTGACGSANVGREGGWIELNPGTPWCACNGWTMRPTTVRHEVGHAMGFWHTESPADLMFASSSQCDMPITDRELAAAAITYARPVGNTDPDQDPSGAVNLAPMIAR